MRKFWYSLFATLLITAALGQNFRDQITPKVSFDWFYLVLFQLDRRRMVALTGIEPVFED
jgi:hypothetical protein